MRQQSNVTSFWVDQGIIPNKLLGHMLIYMHPTGNYIPLALKRCDAQH